MKNWTPTDEELNEINDLVNKGHTFSYIKTIYYYKNKDSAASFEWFKINNPIPKTAIQTIKLQSKKYNIDEKILKNVFQKAGYEHKVAFPNADDINFQSMNKVNLYIESKN